MISIAIFINAIIYNLIIVPIKTIIMTFKYLFSTQINLLKYQYFLLKILLFFFGILIKSYLENTYPLYLIQHKLRNLRGLKIFAFLKIIEFLTLLLNRCHKDYDIQLITIVKTKKIKKKIIAFALLIITFSLNIIALWSYMISMSITLHDSTSDLYPLLFKVNYIELKKCGKPQKKKNLMNQMTTDIFDRFFNYTCLTCVLFQSYHDNKFTSHNIISYFYKIMFIILFEILFDWVKDFVIFRISLFNPSMIKLIAFEIAVYHEKLRLDCFSLNLANGATTPKESNKRKDKDRYKKLIERTELHIVSRQYHYEKYIKYVDYDNVLCLTLQTNIIIYCVLITTVFDQKIKLTSTLVALIIIGMILLRRLIQLVISNWTIKYFIETNGKIKEKDKLKIEASFYVIDPIVQQILEEEKEEVINNGLNTIRSRKSSYLSHHDNTYEMKKVY